MLSTRDNELITQTGPGTPMGQYFRRFWLPALVSSELPSPDCPPVRLKLLSERLIAYRDTNGDIGVVSENCPHRGASLFFGRNEESGLRCVYHGWKFDLTGACVDMPSEPAESNFKTKVRVTAYPTHGTLGPRLALHGPGGAQARAAPVRVEYGAAEPRALLPAPAGEQLPPGCRGRH